MIAAHALTQILVDRPDAHALDARVQSRDSRSRCERVVGLELDHRPGDDTHRDQRFLERPELGLQHRLDAIARLVAVPQIIAEGFDHVIGGDADVRRAALDHLQHALQHADDSAMGAVGALVEAAHAVKVAEQLVGSVDQVDDHSRKGSRIRAVRSDAASDAGRGDTCPRPSRALR